MQSPEQMAIRIEKQKAQITELKQKVRAGKGAKLSTRASTKANGNGKTGRAKTTKARPKARRASTRSVSAAA